jgi:putative ABC transport system substrate-binding protein
MGRHPSAPSSKIIALARTKRLPTMFTGRLAVDAGGLVSYAPSYVAVFRRATFYVDKILTGAGDLPVKQTTKFEPVINLKTARAA